MSSRMRVLVVLSSSNQMYSGIGRAVFEFAKGMASRIEFEFAIDDAAAKNRDLVIQFGQDHGLPVHVGKGFRQPDALDCANADLPVLLARGSWDAVETLCWANTATNEMVLEHLKPESTLAYTPHDQPLSTVAMSVEQATRLKDVHHRVLRRADVVFCDSPAERAALQCVIPYRNSLTFLPLGCDFQQFRAGGWPRKPQLLFVGDLIEPRKRFDRVLAVFSRLVKNRPNLRLVVIGNRSDQVLDIIPEELRAHCDPRGYVSEPELRRTYAESLGLFLLSDFEAFGIPILEALASATPVFLSEQEATRGLFDAFPGAHFCPDDTDSTAGIVEDVLNRGRSSITEVAAERHRLEATFSWGELAERKWRALAAAWFGRRCWAVPA
jgi:glycosyltransferase involved in cell wall biosynthesis